jgi:hypothetical protein
MQSVQLYAEMALYSTLDLIDDGLRLYCRHAPKCLLEVRAPICMALSPGSDGCVHFRA